MATNQSKGQALKIEDAVIAWLMDSDPAIRWQVMRDLLDAPADEVAAERARVATEGWGAHLLALQADDGTWGGAAFNQELNSTMHVLMLLRDLGLDPQSEQARRAVGLVRDRVIWQWWNTSFFAGESEPCINGQVGAAGAYFGQDVKGIIDKLVGEKLPDGGWNCEAENGSTRSSFNTTICVLEALLEYELHFGSDPKVTEVRLQGEDYLLKRHLFHSLSTGTVIHFDRKLGPEGATGYPAWTRFALPTWWHYDVLRGLEYFRHANIPPDSRLTDAIELVESKCDADGRWPLEVEYPGETPIQMNDGVGQPSRWMTLRALRVLKWYAGAES